MTFSCEERGSLAAVFHHKGHEGHQGALRARPITSRRFKRLAGAPAGAPLVSFVVPPHSSAAAPAPAVEGAR